MDTNQHLSKHLAELRESRGWSQEELAKKIGLSRVAISDIENNKRTLSAAELVKFGEAFEVPVSALLRVEQPVQPKRRHAQADITFKPEKLKNTLLYLLSLCGGKPNVGETVLYKLLYFIDFNTYEQTGKPITGLSYVKLQFGPVPMAQEYTPAIQEMTLFGELKIIRQNYYGKSQKRYIAMKDADLDVFTARELNAIEKIADQLSDMTAYQIEDYVHGDEPWKIPNMKEVIPYSLAFERKPPFSQANYGELWQNSSGIDAVKQLGEMSREEYEYYENVK